MIGPVSWHGDAERPGLQGFSRCHPVPPKGWAELMNSTRCIAISMANGIAEALQEIQIGVGIEALKRDAHQPIKVIVKIGRLPDPGRSFQIGQVGAFRQGLLTQHQHASQAALPHGLDGEQISLNGCLKQVREIFGVEISRRLVTLAKNVDFRIKGLQ